MGLGASYRETHDGVGYHLEAALVGSPALGPTAFMHRDSARDHPQAPLVHHYTDSTHTTPGVLTGGVDVHEVTVEASWFRGEEPDEDRLNLDPPKLDSWSARATWHHHGWRAQFSGGHLHRPEFFEPYDVPRLTASIEYDGTIRGRPFAATLLWGENREIHGILDGYLAEWDFAAWRSGTIYGRGEAVAKNLLHLGPEVPGFVDFHPISEIGALTIGYVHDLARWDFGRLGIGADATVYGVGHDFIESYGSPHSFHVFARYRPSRAATTHVH